VHRFARRLPGSRWRPRLVLAALTGVVGLLLLAEFAVTMVWQEPVSYFTARKTQERLDQQLALLEGRARSSRQRAFLQRPPYVAQQQSFMAERLLRRTPKGSPLGRILIPRIGARSVFVASTTQDALKRGPGHYAKTVLPGQRGTVAIAGHRTSYGAPFRHIDALRSGDRIMLVMPYGVFTYRVTHHRVVDPSARWVLRARRHDQLVLTACTPLHSAARRYVVFARPAGIA
jgi:sortase A